MEKEFIPYEEALAMKELGFDEYCLAIFDNEGFRMTKERLKNSEVEGHWRFVFPLYQQAFKWFREKHKLHAWWDTDGRGKWIWYINFMDKGDYFDSDCGDFDKVYDSPEEAQLACLQQLIKIVKECTKQNISL